ncbi:MAG: ABC transporter substrate-binding protein [Thermanaerothrix sp.]|uniref:ABC transporter substrate-binding protein n=1 Tax=Thermanaerothrix sp. TaxID=2972675 RepID=UPI003C7E765B
MNRLKTLQTLVAFLMVVALLLGGCAQATPTAQPEKGAATLPDVIKIGVNETMTGWGAAYGDMTWKGIQLAHEQKPEVLGKKIELVLVDNKSEKSESALAAQRLVEVEKVVAVIGVNSSSMSMAQNEVLDKAKIPSIATAATNPLVTQGKPYAFRAAFIDPFQGDAAAKFAVEELKAKTAVLLVDIALDYPVGLANYFRSSFIKYTGNEKSVLGYFSFQTGDRDFTAQLTQIKSLNPDIIFAPDEYAELGAILQQAKQLGITAQFLAGDSADVPELLQIAGPNAEGFMYTAQFHPDAYTHPEAKQFVEAFRAKYGIDPETFSVTGYDAYLILRDAIERAGSVDPEKIREALESTAFVGARGMIKFDKDHNAIVGVPVIEIKNGKKTFRYLVEPGQ